MAYLCSVFKCLSVSQSVCLWNQVTETDRQTDRQRPTDAPTDRQTDRQTVPHGTYLGYLLYRAQSTGRLYVQENKNHTESLMA